MSNDLISRSAMIKKICGSKCGCNMEECGDDICEAVEMVKEIPTTSDVAEVVRCCKCKNYEHMKQNNECFCNEYGGRVTENDFCSRAVLADSKDKGR